MAEPSRCPYCDEGIPLWIWREEFNDYILQCTICTANGEYKIKQGKGREFDIVVKMKPKSEKPITLTLNGKEELKVAPYSYENLKGIDES